MEDDAEQAEAFGAGEVEFDVRLEAFLPDGDGGGESEVWVCGGGCGFDFCGAG
jgi:hypothetical protein